MTAGLEIQTPVYTNKVAVFHIYYKDLKNLITVAKLFFLLNAAIDNFILI